MPIDYLMKLSDKSVKLRRRVWRDEAALIFHMMQLGGVAQILCVRAFVEQHSRKADDQLSMKDAERVCFIIANQVARGEDFPVRPALDYIGI